MQRRSHQEWLPCFFMQRQRAMHGIQQALRRSCEVSVLGMHACMQFLCVRSHMQPLCLKQLYWTRDLLPSGGAGAAASAGAHLAGLPCAP